MPLQPPMRWIPILLCPFLVLAAGRAASAQAWAAPTPDNGIEVHPPEQYPYRHLERMIADLESQLALLRTVDSAKILQQIGALQGSTRRSSQISVTATETPLPQVTTTLAADDSGELAPSTATVTEAAVTPTPPVLPTTAAGGLASPTFGPAASDVLSEQVQLQHQAYNLRLLQQRSISDRFYDDGMNQGSRVMALIGVTIEIMPRREHRKSAAVVELTLRSKVPGKRSPSLVALMPEEQTYNAVAHSTKSNAFGGAVLAGVVPLGFSGRWDSEELYLYQDTDTVAFSRAPVGADAPELTFGWQFRPVLNRKSVESGRRHLFAVLALDELESLEGKTFPFEVSARSYWLRYSPKRRVLRGGPIQRQDFSAPWPLEIKNTVRLHKGWTPKIASVTSSPIGGDKLLVRVQGENFHPTPTIQIGSRKLSGEEMTYRSDQSLEFVAPIAEILANRARIIGAEYGFSVPLEVALDDSDRGMRIERFEFGPERNGNQRDLMVYLRGRNEALPKLHGRTVYATFSDNVYELPAERWISKLAGNCSDCCDNCLRGWVQVPISDVTIDTEISVQIPFLGENYVSTSYSHQAMGISRIELLESGDAKNGDPTVWGLVGWGFDRDGLDATKVYAGKPYGAQNGLARVSPQLLTLTAPAAELSEQKEVLIFLPGYLEPVKLKAPGVPPEKKAPEVTGAPPEVGVNSSRSVLFNGEGLSSISKVVFEGNELQTQMSKQDLRVFLTRAVTKGKGKVELLGYWDDKRFVSLEVIVK